MKNINIYKKNSMFYSNLVLVSFKVLSCCPLMALQVAVSSPTAMGKGSSPHHHPPPLCVKLTSKYQFLIHRPIGCFFLVHVGISEITLEFFLIVPIHMFF